MRLRNILWRQLDPEAYGKNGLSPTNIVVVWIVVLSSVLAIVETEPTIERRAPQTFMYIEQILAVLFAVEYLIRLWAEGENPRFGGVRGRIRYALTPAAIIDLAAFLPSLIAPLPGLAIRPGQTVRNAGSLWQKRVRIRRVRQSRS